MKCRVCLGTKRLLMLNTLLPSGPHYSAKKCYYCEKEGIETDPPPTHAIETQDKSRKHAYALREARR